MNLNEAQVEAVANADAYATNAALPSYSTLLAFAEKVARIARDGEEVGNPPMMLRILGDEARAAVAH